MSLEEYHFRIFDPSRTYRVEDLTAQCDLCQPLAELWHALAIAHGIPLTVGGDAGEQYPREWSFAWSDGGLIEPLIPVMSLRDQGVPPGSTIDVRLLLFGAGWLLGPGLWFVPRALRKRSSAGVTFHLLQIDPGCLDVCVETAGLYDGRERTAAQWCRDRNLLAAINLGPPAEAGHPVTGYLRSDGREVVSAWRAEYRAAVGLCPRRPELPPLHWLDPHFSTDKDALRDYALVIQNPHVPDPRPWHGWFQHRATGREGSRGVAALATDSRGRLAFLFCREALTVTEFGRGLRAGSFDLFGLMLLCTGAAVSLSIHAGGHDLDLCGAAGPGASANDPNDRQRPIGGVIGVRVRV